MRRRATFPTDITLGFYGKKHTEVFLIWLITAFIVIWCLLANFTHIKISLDLNVFDIFILALSLVFGCLLFRFTTALGNLLTVCVLASGLYLFRLYGLEVIDTLSKLFEIDAKDNLFFIMLCSVCIVSIIIAQILEGLLRLFFLIPIKWFNHSYFLSLIRDTVTAFIVASELFFLYLLIILGVFTLVLNGTLSVEILSDEWLQNSCGVEIFVKTLLQSISLGFYDELNDYQSLLQFF